MSGSDDVNPRVNVRTFSFRGKEENNKLMIRRDRYLSQILSLDNARFKFFKPLLRILAAQLPLSGVYEEFPSPFVFSWEWICV